MKNLLPLLKREFQEHRGGLLLTPFIAGAVLAVLLVLGLVTGASGLLKVQSTIGGEITRYAIQNNPELIAPAASKALQAFGLAAAAIINLTCAIVVFFYCLGSLYDDRKDRSILFWRSLPVSDAESVIAKVITAALVAPAIAFVATVATQMLMWLCGAVVVLVTSGSLKGMLGGNFSFFSGTVQHLIALPIHVLWVMPVVGWLMLASAFAKTKPFLWAVLPPLGIAIADSWFDVTRNLSMPSNTVFRLIGERLFDDPLPMAANLSRDAVGLIGSLVPGAVAPGIFDEALVYLKMPGLWLGALAGAAFIAFAIFLRRKSEEAY